MIIDTSALVAILYGEDEASSFTQIIQRADICRLSVANYLELTMVIEKQLGLEGTRHAENFVRRAGIQIEHVTVEQGHIARQAFFDFGKGRHKAQLNFGDCFAYALAKAVDEPLLFKGNDFIHTDVENALPHSNDPNDET
ncbi:type II toxin-antitoxin system VapC family toxin [Sphingomonas sp. AP4-R1]|uniref:type II toxin-antitoxin system VapC family toxin n=1 Tax=Sphingomonas sp. AP4-R1 TaxID=2735134 RepID=UPI0014932BCD|nr:type II toxin-antitoxin system VapC family toxin [Sphingomonas sp. AP4-R1]QJU58417.1 type II toxin-antitoxin system VapC family toxin [Sphingomonas sp. AP4-R1]